MQEKTCSLFKLGYNKFQCYDFSVVDNTRPAIEMGKDYLLKWKKLFNLTPLKKTKTSRKMEIFSKNREFKVTECHFIPTTYVSRPSHFSKYQLLLDSIFKNFLHH